MKSEILKFNWLTAASLGTLSFTLSPHHNQWYARKRSVCGRLEEKITGVSGPQTAACQILITISFSLGVQFKAFTFGNWPYLFICFMFTSQLAHLWRLSLEYALTVPRCLGWAASLKESRAQFLPVCQLPAAYRLWRKLQIEITFLLHIL